MVDELREKLVKIPKVGTAKIAGFVCNKKAPFVLRLDLEIPAEELKSALDVLGLEPTEEIEKSLETALKAFRKSKSRK